MILKNFKKKKILILGSNIETAPLIERANKKNLITFVIGKEKTNKTKQIADFPIQGDAANFQFVNDVIRKNKIDAVMIGTVDILLKNYEEVCRKNKLPCYANKRSVSYFSSKNSFNKISKKFGFKNIPDYTNHVKNKNILPDNFFPVLVKPVDSGGGVGAKICYSNSQLKVAAKEAKIKSKKT